jgi:precorrin-6B methylase 2
VPSVLRKALAAIKNPRAAVNNLQERAGDWRFGIRTRGELEFPEVGIILGSQRHAYHPITYRGLLQMLNAVGIQPHDVFIDFGSGLGRVLVVTSRMRLRRVIGVELSEELCKMAEANLARAKGRRRVDEVVILNQDVTAYELPDDSTILFFNNPFHGPILRQVLQNIRASLLRQPRPAKILFFNTERFEAERAALSWVYKIKGRLLYRSDWALYGIDLSKLSHQADTSFEHRGSNR